MNIKTVAQEISNAVQARLNCIEHMSRLNPNAVTASTLMQDNEWHQKHAWLETWTSRLNYLAKNFLPSGSGFDSGTQINLSDSHADKLVFYTSFHHMNDAGFYDGWTEHTVTVTPSFQGFNIRVSGRNRNDIKEYIGDEFYHVLSTSVEFDVDKDKYIRVGGN